MSFGRERVYYKSTEEKFPYLGRNIRNHLARTHGWGGYGPLVEEFEDIHGQEAVDRLALLRSQGIEGRNILVGDRISVENGNDTSPTKSRPFISLEHQHPETRVPTKKA